MQINALALTRMDSRLMPEAIKEKQLHRLRKQKMILHIGKGTINRYYDLTIRMEKLRSNKCGMRRLEMQFFFVIQKD